MNEAAIAIVQNCLDTKDPYLDLGMLGLTDEDFAEGTPLDALLRQCTHLQALILSNYWGQRDTNGKYKEHKSCNRGNHNKFSIHPPALFELNSLITLIIAGDYWGKKWGIKDMDFVAGFTALQHLNISCNKISEIKNLNELTGLVTLTLSRNKIRVISGLDTLVSLSALDLRDNQINTINGLDTLIGLGTLDLSYNQISTIKGLESLTGLGTLSLSRNQIGVINGLDTLTGLNSLYLNGNQISVIKGLDTLTDLSILDLSYNQISIIKGLESLTGLGSLNLSSNQISEMKGLGTLTNLDTLYFSRNQISEIKGLDTLTNLAKLNLNDNQISVINGLNTLTSLVKLNLSSNKISTMNGLSTLTSLKTLYISSNQISAIKGLDILTGLAKLNLSSNKISEIQGLENLTSLGALDLSYNKIGAINGLDILTGLGILDLRGNKISEIQGLGTLTGLGTLDLRSNQISEIKGLDSLTALETLYLNFNKITEIKGLDSLTTLETLYLSYNKISEIKELEKIATLTDLKLFDNPLRDMPPELAGEKEDYNCMEDCRNWWAEIAGTANTQKNTLVKLQLIGNGGVGKSSLLEALEKGQCETQYKSTHGVRVLPLLFDVPGCDIAFSAWDFGGQEIYHGTHRLFIGSEAVQVIVFDSEAEQCARDGSTAADRIRQEEQVLHLPIAHYIQLCRRYSSDSQLILVQNKLPGGQNPDAGIQHLAIEEEAGFAATDALTGRGILPLRGLLAEKGMLLRHYGRIMPKSWLAVRDYFLANAAKPAFERLKLITNEQFAQICTRNGVMERSIPSLLRLLHGTSLVYANEQLLSNTIITDLHWALDAIYKPLDRGSDFYDDMAKDYWGRVRVKHLFKAFGNNYSTSEKWLFLGFMVSCRLCFALYEPHLPDKSEDRYYIFPQFLPTVATPAVQDGWASAAEVQNFYCTPPYLDYYRIQQFIVALGNKTPVQFIWKLGILVTTELGMFKVTANQATNTLQMQIEQKAVAKYLPYIIDTFEKGTSQQSHAAWMQGSNAATATPLDVEALRRQAAEKEQPSSKTKPLPKNYLSAGCDDEAPPLQGNEPANVVQVPPRRLVISYASEDLSARDALEKSLYNYVMNGELAVQYDEQAVDGEGGWDEDIKELFEEADGYVILVSQDYQFAKKKKYIWEYEVPLMEARNAAGCFVWCISATPVDYNDRLQKFAAFKGGKECLPETGHERLQFLKDFAVKVIGDKFLKQ
jgi:Leucine-rich repeat (LRR) protein